MKVSEILHEGEQHYQILDVERDVSPQTGSSKQGHIEIPYADLVHVFGKPQSHVQDDRADVNWEWDFTIKYKDPLNDEHVDNEDDFDYVRVSIYDYRIDNESRRHHPETIRRWTVGGKSRTGLLVLDDMLRSKGLI